MPNYYLQSASDDTRTRSFRGKQPAHNHGASNKFSQAITELWRLSFNSAPRLGHFQSAQSNPAADVELHWNDGMEQWES